MPRRELARGRVTKHTAVVNSLAERLLKDVPYGAFAPAFEVANAIGQYSRGRFGTPESICHQQAEAIW